MKKNLFLLVVFALWVGGAPHVFAAEKLSIQKLVFADEMLGLGQYTPKDGTRFTLDDTCSVYVEAVGFAMPLSPKTQDEYNVDLAVDVKVKLPQSGRRLTFQPDMAKLVTKIRSHLTAQALGFSFSFEGWTPGNYILEVGLRDNLGGQTVSQDIPLQLVEPTEADTKARLEREARENEQNAPQKPQ
ncbi:MAG: hypothetical protein LBP21_10335 [Synergistaceae bacterium]|jgi:hypothetical protein|nr:hypothetical protein [Synergistaceae bacterium]